MPDLPPTIRYFRKIRLRHKLSGLYLSATVENYGQEWSAKDQTAVVLLPASNDPDFDWIIRPPCGMDFIKSLGDEVKLKDTTVASPDNVVRFYNEKHHRHLHSHGDRSAPWAPEDDFKSEVTLFTPAPFGDVNDNWQLQQTTNNNDDRGQEASIRHFATGKYLTNDGRPEVELKSKRLANVVWTEEELAQDSYWIIEPQTNSTSPFEPELLGSYQSEGLEVVVRTLKDAEDLVDRVKSAYEPIKHAFSTAGFVQIVQAISNTIVLLERTLQDLRDFGNIENFEQRVVAFRAILNRAFTQTILLDPATPNFQFINSLLQNNPREAAYVYMRLTKMEIGDGADESAIEGLIKLALFQRFGDRLPEETWQRFFKESEAARQILEQKVAHAEKRLGAIVSSSEDLFERTKVHQSRLLEDGERKLESIREDFRGQEIAEAPGNYWKKKGSRHRWNILWLGIAFGFSVISTVAALVAVFFFWHPDFGITNASSTATSPPTASDFFVHFTLPIAALASLVVWLIKAISRNLISQIHLEADARERETMLLTFRALLQDKDKPLSDEEKKIIVAIVFRPGGSGLGDETSGPTFWWETLLKK